MIRSLIFVAAATLLPLSACAQTPSPAPEPTALQAITGLDAQIFEAAFLTCDEATLRRIMAPDLEFYHDLYGNIAQDVDGFLSGTLPDCEARKRGDAPYVERRLIADSLHVRPIGDWGAMQTGQHVFIGKSDTGEDVVLETGLFTHIWQKTDAGWKIKRVISYDHAPG